MRSRDNLEEFHLYQGKPFKRQFEIYDLSDYLKKNKTHAVKPHSHSFYQIIWFFNNDGTHYVDFESFEIKKNTIFFLPTNGGEGLEEHAWYHDYGNVRIVGLDSNGYFAGEDQLNWLDQILTQTCEQEEIDFVFAQLHPPHKSELWTPGELGFAGEVISRLETFSTDCGKPSIHFFGHTHGYSRGQSRDHKHLWVNVATAGGAIDNWGEFPQFDYEEFTVSQDEWGFVARPRLIKQYKL